MPCDCQALGSPTKGLDPWPGRVPWCPIRGDPLSSGASLRRSFPQHLHGSERRITAQSLIARVGLLASCLLGKALKVGEG